ncbi:hypothetical protein FPV67DRAFT_1669946 [Lyophyllum atratum]|nr:hypothetical protein FPV67DRAFT_1669946 [Lyophyllum atratum]
MASKQVAFVTGAAQGIGRAVALRLAEDGFDVAMNDLPRWQESLDDLSREIADKYGRRVCCVVGDVSVEAEVEAMVARVVKELGSLNVMVANAGVAMVKSLSETTAEDWDRLFGINVRGIFLCYKYAARQMISQGGGGRIIGASSASGKQGEAYTAAYCSTKFAIRGLTQSAAREYGAHGITVNAYAPGAIDTPLLRNIAGENLAALVEGESKKTAVGYIGTPADVASVVSYLASKEAHFITGQSVSVNGGSFFD